MQQYCDWGALVKTYLEVLRAEIWPAEVVLSVLPAVELVEPARVVVVEGC